MEIIVILMTPVLLAFFWRLPFIIKCARLRIIKVKTMKCLTKDLQDVYGIANIIIMNRNNYANELAYSFFLWPF